MATATPSGYNYHRLMTLTVDQGTIVVRQIFDERISNLPLHQFLAQEKKEVKSLRAKHIITKVQYDTLFPPSGNPPPTTADFDITLVVCLLRNMKACGLNPNCSWGEPQPGDTSLEADISRLLMYRNTLSHIPETTTIDDIDFNKIWSDTEQVLIRLNNRLHTQIPNLQQCIDDLKNGDFFPEEQKRKHGKEITEFITEKLFELGREVEEKFQPKETAIPCDKPLESFYSDSSAREKERRQIGPTGGQYTAQPGSIFFGTRELHVKETVFESSVLVDASNRVCMICFHGRTATGFRVGTKYILTANYVLKIMTSLGQSQDTCESLKDSDVYALFGYTTDGPRTETRKYRFKAIVHFHDCSTDTAVLELEDNTVGTPMPPPFTYFSLPKLNQRFTFIGHCEGNEMKFDHVDGIIDMDSEETQRSIVHVKQMSLQHTGKDYEFDHDNKLTNPDRFLFNCKFTKGAGGSPGVVILEDGRVVVVTMLLRGFPDWYYDTFVPDYIKTSWPKDYCVKQGVNMKSVYEKMRTANPGLCREIFYSHTHTD